jgi:hypothetical protein
MFLSLFTCPRKAVGMAPIGRSSAITKYVARPAVGHAVIPWIWHLLASSADGFLQNVVALPSFKPFF